MKSALAAAAALALATAGLAGCNNTPETPAVQAVGIPGMTISNPRVVLAPVKGNPAAVYFDLKYDGDDGVALSRVDVKGAKSASFHEYVPYQGKQLMQESLPLPLKKGDTVEFKPGGKHVMAMDLSPDLQPGQSTDVTIYVAGGAKQTLSAPIKAAGDER